MLGTGVEATFAYVVSVPIIVSIMTGSVLIFVHNSSAQESAITKLYIGNYCYVQKLFQNRVAQPDEE
jgi:hypothetical protein